jgi:ribosomal protein S8
MISINRFKLILSKLKVAQLNRKKIIKINLFLTDLKLLNLLWKNGFIYGYCKCKKIYNIFLKYTLKGLGVLNSMTFFNKIISKKELNNILWLNSGNSYLILSFDGLKIYSGNSKVIFGGVLMAKF